MNIKKNKIKKVSKIGINDETYVYDIGMKNENHPWFFGNNILLHNSAYFSAYKSIGDEFDWNKENVMELYDTVSNEVSNSFSAYMMSAFNTSQKRGEIIQAGREALSTRGIFLKKKRYCLLCYDIEGRRYDINGEAGYIKAMGVEIKRSDTPKVIQTFLSDVLLAVLSGGSEDDAFNIIRAFTLEFRKWPAHLKGSPKGVNGLTQRVEIAENNMKVNMPGHVRASWNWNKLRDLNNDKYSLSITDGSKIMVCALKHNSLGYTSIAYPVDEEHLPEWFKSLPFDDKLMEEKLIHTKIENLFGVLGWKLRRPEADSTFGSLFV